jgi:hypothetical protein
MPMRSPTSRWIIALLACGAATPALAVGAHKWIDEKGVTHYSDEAPAAIETTFIDLPDPVIASPENDGADNYYSISNQWERMNRERLEREKLLLEKAKIEAARQPPPQPVVYVQDSGEDRIIPVYRDFRYRKHRGQRRHYRSHRSPGLVRPLPAPPLSGGFPTR